MSTIVLVGRIFSVTWCCSEWECPKSFLAHSDFGIGYLRNNAMHAFGEYTVVILRDRGLPVQKLIQMGLIGRLVRVQRWECSLAPPG